MKPLNTFTRIGKLNTSIYRVVVASGGIKILLGKW